MEAWTGVILPNPMEVMASRIHSAREGVRASHALGSFLASALGAIVQKVVFMDSEDWKEIYLLSLSGLKQLSGICAGRQALMHHVDIN